MSVRSDASVPLSAREQWLLMSPAVATPVGARGVGMLVARIVRGVLKIRYLLIGGTLAGGYSIQKVFGAVDFINIARMHDWNN